MKVAATCLALIAVALPAAADAAHATKPRNGEYSFSGKGKLEFLGGLKLGPAGVSGIGITTDNLQCQRPGAAPYYPGPPYNWQPQKTLPIKHVKGGVSFSASLSFLDRINAFPETMQISARITAHGITGKVSMTADDNTAGSGELICHTRGFLSFSGKHN